MSVTDFTKPFYLSDTEQALAKSTVDAIVHSGTISLDPDGSMPETVKNFVDILNALAEGQSITVISRQSELTLSQAAEFLCVSEDYLAGLLDSGEIESKFSGGCRMAAMDSLLQYKETKKNLRLSVLAELVAESQEMDQD